MQMVRLTSSQFSLQIKWDILNPNLGQKESRRGLGKGSRRQDSILPIMASKREP